jgi:hypothetical protein
MDQPCQFCWESIVSFLECLLGGKKVYVSPPVTEGGGTEGGTGTFADPVHSVAAGIALAQGGGCVYLRQGVYVESLDLTDVHGTWLRPILVRSFKGEHATIDSSVTHFRGSVPNMDWKPAEGGAVPEYVSTVKFPEAVVKGGAFLDDEKHTRLIAYDRLEDLQSTNELWTENVGHEVVGGPPDKPGLRRPDVYMGPGIWFDESDNSDEGRRVHIRLSHTNNQIDGWPDYEGETDPRHVRLALSMQEDHVLRLVGSRHVRFRDLTMRFGGEDTIRLRNCFDVLFDHVQIRAASRAIRLQCEAARHHREANWLITFRHCEIDGGIPTWFFRSDRKDAYRFRPVPGGPVVLNNLGYATGGVLVSGDRRSFRITIHHCELTNGHDVYVFGDKMRFHHNLVRNLNDDALGIGIVSDTKAAQVYQNVIQQSLTALSFAGECPVDVRVPTAGLRPQQAPGPERRPRTLRQGQFFKDGRHEGPFDLFHNTCLVYAPGAIGADYDGLNDTGFTHYGNLTDSARRRSFNNIFVAVYPPETSRPIAHLPPNTFDGPTDGNCYFRVGPDIPDAFVVVGRPAYPDLGSYRAAQQRYEEGGAQEDPQFRSFATDGLPRPSDDLRLRPGSPSRENAVALPLDLWWMDAKVRGLLSLGSRRRGCYPANARLRVGVDRRQSFPPA